VERKERWDRLFDYNYSVSTAFPEEANKELFLQQKILGETNEELYELRIQRIEEIDARWRKECAIAEEERKLKVITDQATVLLDASNKTQLPDAEYVDEDFNVRPYTQEEKLEWREYRKYLRRIPRLFKNKQILELRVMGFEEWRLNKPVYKD
jgi:hypothetical protein